MKCKTCVHKIHQGFINCNESGCDCICWENIL